MALEEINCAKSSKEFPSSIRVIAPEHAYRGRQVYTPWSSAVTVMEVLYSVQVDRWIFHGVKVVNKDQLLWDLPEVDNLLWVFDDGRQLKTWQGISQRPRFDDESEYEIEASIGYHRSVSGNVFVGVKWRGYECPTWELENDLLQCGELDEDDMCKIGDSE